MVCYIGFKCKLFCCEGIDLFLKSGVCVFDLKCKVENVFGQYGQCCGCLFDYGLQLCEKQKVCCIYGVLECQFCGYYQEVFCCKGFIGENLL